jgi:hypothetical protein
VSAEPLPPADPDAGGQGEPSAVEEHLKQLLAAARDPERAPPELRDELAEWVTARATDPARRLRVTGRARKVSVSIPEDLTAAVQHRVGRGAFSQYVTEAVARQLESDLLGELISELDKRHGPVPDHLVAEAGRAWPDAG